MKEIPLDDLTSWYIDATKKKLGSVKKLANKRISKVKKLCDEMTKSCLLLQNKCDNPTDVSAKSALKFAEKVIERMKNIEFPDEDINYLMVSNFKLELERFLRDVYDYGKRLIKKLDRSYRPDIQEINYLLQEINSNYLKIKKVLDKKYGKLRIIEIKISQIESLEDAFDELLDNNKEKKEMKGKIEEDR